MKRADVASAIVHVPESHSSRRSRSSAEVHRNVRPRAWLDRQSSYLFGYELLNDPLLNKGTAFTNEERDAFEVHGLLPPNVATLDEQVTRRMQAFRQLPSDLERYVFLRGLQDSVEVLFYALLLHDLAGMLPVVYTPTVGLGCQEFSHTFRKPRGLFLCFPRMERIKSILACWERARPELD